MGVGCEWAMVVGVVTSLGTFGQRIGVVSGQRIGAVFGRYNDRWLGVGGGSGGSQCLQALSNYCVHV